MLSLLNSGWPLLFGIRIGTTLRKKHILSQSKRPSFSNIIPLVEFGTYKRRFWRARKQELFKERKELMAPSFGMSRHGGAIRILSQELLGLLTCYPWRATNEGLTDHRLARKTRLMIDARLLSAKETPRMITAVSQSWFRDMSWLAIRKKILLPAH